MLLRDGKRKHEGPGITLEERTKVVTRFYRLDRSWSLPGNGLDLAIVTAISHLHGDSLALEDAAPGLIARIVLRRVAACTPTLTTHPPCPPEAAEHYQTLM